MPMRFGRTVSVLGAVGLTTLVRGAHADPLPTSADHVVSPGRSIVGDDTGDAIVLNPANLAYLPAPELRWTGVRCPNEAVMVGCGQAIEGAAPLPFGLATALRVDYVQPPWGGPETVGVGYPYRGYDFGWLTWGLAARLGEGFSLGFSIDHSYSQNPVVGGLTGLTAALSWRVNSHFALSGVARDFNRPSTLLQINGLPVLDGKYAVGFGFRPTGRRNVELGVELQYWEAEGGADQVTDRVTLGVDIPYVGRAFGAVDVAHLPNDERRGVVGTAGLELHWGGLSAGGGALFGDGLGSSGTVAEYATAAISAYTQPGIPALSHASWIRLEDTPGTRGHVALLRKLWRLADDRSVDAVTLILRAEPAASYAHAEELADALRVLRAHHKKVLCSLEDGGPKALYVCANADRIVISPAGGVRYAGLRSEYMYLKGLLDKIGVKAEIVRIGPHKSAGEQFTNEHAGPVAAADHEDMLRQVEAVFVRNMSLYRHMSEDRVRAETRRGPFVAEEAKAAGFIDGVAFDDELEHVTRELVGRDVAYVKDTDETKAPSSFGPRGKLALLYLDGDMIDGRSRHIPLIDMKLAGSYSMADSIKQLREDPTVRAVVLRIESPGGSSLSADVMWRELVLLAKAKPLIVSMGSVAASGGYYVASASKDIYALPLTVTGSIGIFYGKADISGLLDKIGVTIDTYKTTPRADAESLFRSYTPDERQELERKIEQFYGTFLDRVAQGRGMTKEQVDAVGRGRVWTGEQALERHLVDHLGGLREALAAARRAALLPDDVPIVEVPAQGTSLVDVALRLAGVSGPEQRAVEAMDALPPAVRGIAHALGPMMVYGGDEPLARLEWVDAVDVH
jgi:protease-4